MIAQRSGKTDDDDDETPKVRKTNRLARTPRNGGFVNGWR